MFAAFLVSVPLLTGFVISRSLSGPIWDSALYFNEHVFDTTTQQKLAGAKEVCMLYSISASKAVSLMLVRKFYSSSMLLL